MPKLQARAPMLDPLTLWAFLRMYCRSVPLSTALGLYCCYVQSGLPPASCERHTRKTTSPEHARSVRALFENEVLSMVCELEVDGKRLKRPQAGALVASWVGGDTCDDSLRAVRAFD